ncbi:ribosome biogenesis GTPase Der [Nitratifractor sp.]
MKKVAILGRPNVGKSSLFNRLARRRDAITSDVSGTTRDLKKNVVTISEDREFELIDTGGIDESDALFSKVAEMSMRAAEEADVILYMVDGKTLPEEEDRQLFYRLQALGKPIALVVNKIDNDREEQERFWEFVEFGAETIFPISVSHNRKLTPLYQWLEQYIPPVEKSAAPLQADEDLSLEQLLEAREEPEAEEKKVKVAILGRPNVGKSSLLNALLGEERAVVSEVAGTTIDPVDETIVHDDYEITFVDTAGIRRRSKILGIEKYALGRTEKMLEEADIAILIIDATAGVTELDERIAGLIDKYRLGALIVVNKWDIRGEKEYKEAIQEIRDELKFLHYAPILTVSAKTKQRVQRILDQITAIYRRYTRRIPTSKLNEVVQYAIRRHHVPSHHGQVVRIKFATQFASKPPRIALVVNKPELLHFSYKRYLANVLREQFDFEGVPLEIVARKRGERSEEE